MLMDPKSLILGPIDQPLALDIQKILSYLVTIGVCLEALKTQTSPNVNEGWKNVDPQKVYLDV